MKRLGIVAVALSMSACASAFAPGRDPPDRSWTVAQNAKTVSNCLVQSLNREFHTDNKLSMSITYKIETVELDRVYEVRPQQLLIVGGEPYFVRVTAGQATTRVELFAVWTMVRQLSRPIEMCV